MSHNRCGLCHVEIKGLTVISGKDTLLENINLHFCCGELTALIGRNGAGKTTLLKSILGQKPHEGTILFTDLHGKSIPVPKIGYVPQHLEFDRSMPATVADFMAAARGGRPGWLGQSKKQRGEIQNILEEMDAAYLADRRLGALSGGELQRVLLALAASRTPDLLILDEPVSGMDMAGTDLFYKRVMELRDKRHIAILLVSHDFGLIREYADKVVLLDKTVMAYGTAEEVFRGETFRQAFGYLDEKEAKIWI